MGIVPHEGVLPWVDGGDPDIAGPVGTRKIWPQDHTATLVHVVDGMVVYGPESPLGVYASEVRELPRDVAEQLGMPRMHAWLFTARQPAGDAAEGLADHTVSFSALPYSQNRFFVSQLRRASHAKASVVSRLLVDILTDAATAPDPEQRLQSALEKLSFVPFVQESRRTAATHAAWMVYPSRHQQLGTGRFDAARNYTVGVCRDYARCTGFLEIDPIVTADLESTVDGTLLLNEASTSTMARNGSRGRISRALCPAAVENRDLALHLAIKLAMAGVEADRFPAGRSRRVAAQVSSIYRALMYGWSRRCDEPYPVRDHMALDEVSRRAVAAPTDDGESEPSSVEERANLQDQLRALGYDSVIPRFSDQAATMPAAWEDFLNLLLACPDSWALPPVITLYLERSVAASNDDTLKQRIRRRLATS